MKTSIYISGQINGNHTLKNAIATLDCEIKSEVFNGYTLTFRTKKEAKKAMWDAFKYLRSDEPGYKGLRYYAPGASLQYDASIAKIVKK